MRGVHAELHELKGMAEPLDEVARRVAKRHRLICFDEFHVSDIADAMILYRLLDRLFELNIGFVITSNYAPDALYPDGLHRDRMLPAIELLKGRLDVVHVDGGVDYRRRAMERIEAYLAPWGEEAERTLAAAFERVAETEDDDPVLTIESRSLRARRRAGGVVWFDFAVLCGGPRFAERLPGDRVAVPHRGAVECAANVGGPGVGSATLHLAGRRALRPPGQAAAVRRGGGGGTLSSGRTGERIRAHGVSTRGNAVPRVPGVASAGCRPCVGRIAFHGVKRLCVAFF